MTRTFLASPPADSGKIRTARLAWIAETLRLLPSLSHQTLRAPGVSAARTFTRP